MFGEDIDNEPSGNEIEHYYRIGKYPPSFIFDELIGINPQKRRAFLLAQRFRIPLSFDWVILSIFSSTASYILTLLLIKVLWTHFLIDKLNVTIALTVFLSVAFIAYRRAQVKNQSEIKEELELSFILDCGSLIIAVYVVYFDVVKQLL